MLYTFTVVVNLIALAVAIWLGIYIASLLNKPNNEIMSRLYISEGTFNRTRRAAIRPLGRVLSGMEVAAQ